MRLVIARHGETEENLRKIIQGHLPGKLSKKGIAQAKKLAKRLSGEKFDVIFSSDLKRARDTAEEITKFHKKTPLYFLKELRERNWGVFQGKKRKEYREYFNSCSKKDILRAKPKKGESYGDARKRALNFYSRLLREYPGKNVLVISHGMWMRIFLGIIMNLPLEDIFSMHLGNTAVNIIEIDKKSRHNIISFNCTKHLR